ncbi:MAG: hypothetical protein CMI66_14630 [Pedosphaera sp.]|nr:hypothetical protein [Pedosphaera sp.]
MHGSGNAFFVDGAQNGMRRPLRNRLIYEFIPFMDEHGRHLFHDRDHLSYYGTSMLKESLSDAILRPPTIVAR